MHTLFLDPQRIIETFGLLGIGLAIFAECGLFFGIFLPGDSLLFAAGFLASTGVLHIFWVILIAIVASILGNIVGFLIGQKAGEQFENKNIRFLKKEYFEKTKIFFEKHGRKSIIFARFVPIIRTLIPPLSGVGQMPLSSFIKWSVVGGVLWSILLPTIGYTLPHIVPSIDRYIVLVVLAINFISFLPAIYGFFKVFFEKKK